MTYLAVVLLSVALTPPFGEAEATAVSATGSEVDVDVVVGIETGAEIVLAQPYGPDRAAFGAGVPMSNLGDGAWGARLTLPRRADMRIGFEILDGAVTERSEVHTLVELGVDPTVLRDATPAVPGDAGGRSGTPWGWLALAAITAVLAVVALVLAMGYREPAGTDADLGDDRPPPEDRAPGGEA